VAAALGMIAPVVAEASRLLGLPAGLLRGLAAHPDLVALVEREIAAREAGTSQPAAGDRRPGFGAPDAAVRPDPWALLREQPDSEPGAPAHPDPWSLLREPPEGDSPASGPGGGPRDVGPRDVGPGGGPGSVGPRDVSPRDGDPDDGWDAAGGAP
jgi:hypothetical protein